MSSTHQPPQVGALRSSPSEYEFRLWAPFAKRVVLRLSRHGLEGESAVTMEQDGAGYHVAQVRQAKPGDFYRFELGEGLVRPDPASRFQPEGVHGASAVVDPNFDWSDAGWQGPDLPDYVIYELHVGTFTEKGTFDSAIAELDRLSDLGVTAIELMPVAQFPGSRNWGYDGVYPFAVQNSYGGPLGLKRFVDACHSRRLAVVLDVVYNHLGPEGNYLRDFGPYFTNEYRTPWGDALNFDGPGSDAVRAYFIQNALTWQTEFHIDAIRLDAVHAIKDASAYPFLAELAYLTHARAAEVGKPFYLIAESDLNDSRLVRPRGERGYALDSMWSDDYHHAAHTLLTGEREGYYEDFGKLDHLAAAYQTGFTYQGQQSLHRQRRHGNSPKGLNPWQFVVSCQNHDQIGNRAHGERLAVLVDKERLKLAAGLTLLSPYIPLLFMGEEYGETAPFLYFVSHGDPELVEAVRKGRREEFSKFTWQGEVPDPQAESTLERSRLDQELARKPAGGMMLALYKRLIHLRKERQALGCRGRFPPEVTVRPDEHALETIRLAQASECRLLFHFGESEVILGLSWPAGEYGLLLDSASISWDGPGSRVPEVLKVTGATSLVLQPSSFVVYQRSLHD